MNYKEKYERALKVAKETYDKQPMYREWLEKMFPELKESEDEKIRKVLVDFFRDWRENRSHCWGIAVSKILAWLENIPVTIDHEKREGFHLGYKAGFEEQGEHKPTDEEMKTLLRTEYEKGRADAIAEIQNRWKPSDEQMQALKHAFNDGSITYKEMEILGTLYEQLKALHHYEWHREG